MFISRLFSKLLLATVPLATMAVQPCRAENPAMTVDHTVLDLGRVSLEEASKKRQLECTFKMTNTGQEKAKIEQVATSCGCTSAIPSQTEIAPGDSADLKVAVNLEGRSGYNEVQVFVGFANKDILKVSVKYQVEIGAKLFPIQVNVERLRDQPSRFTAAAYLAFPSKVDRQSIPKIELVSAIPGIKITPKDTRLTVGANELTGYYYCAIEFVGEVPAGLGDVSTRLTLIQDHSPIAAATLNVREAKSVSLTRDAIYLGRVKTGGLAKAELNLSQVVEDVRPSVEIDGLVKDSISVKRREDGSSVIQFNMRWKQHGALTRQSGVVVTGSGQRLPFTCLVSQ